MATRLQGPAISVRGGQRGSLTSWGGYKNPGASHLPAHQPLCWSHCCHSLNNRRHVAPSRPAAPPPSSPFPVPPSRLPEAGCHVSRKSQPRRGPGWGHGALPGRHWVAPEASLPPAALGKGCLIKPARKKSCIWVWGKRVRAEPPPRW